MRSRIAVARRPGQAVLRRLVVAGAVGVLGSAAVGSGAATAAPASATGSTSGSCKPRVIDLGTLGGANSEIAGDNGRDTFAGQADTKDGQSRAVLWRLGGKVLDLGLPDAGALDISPSGVVVGNTGTHAFAWYRGHAVQLAQPSWAVSAEARRINARGDVAGLVVDKQRHTHAVVWQRLEFLRVLPTPQGYTDADVRGINDAGLLVGYGAHPQHNPVDPVEQDAWWWHEDGSNGALQPDYPGGFEQANLVNGRGWAAGGLDYGGKVGLWPAVWRNGSVVRLGPTGPGTQYGFAYGGDQVGDYVGNAGTPSDNRAHVFLTHIGTHRLDTLRPLSGKLSDGSNAHSVIAQTDGYGTVVGGDSTTSDGHDHATLWTCAWQQLLPLQVVLPSSALNLGALMAGGAGPRGR